MSLKLWTLTLLLLTLFAVSKAQNQRKIELVSADKLRKSLFKLFEDQWNNTKKDSVHPVDVVRKFIDFRNNGFDDFDSKVTNNSVSEALNSVLPADWGRINLKILKVDALYDTFKRFQKQQTGKNRSPSPKNAWIRFADAILTNIPNTLKSLHKNIQETNFFNKIKDLDQTAVCTMNQSSSQLLYNLYNTIALTEMKGYAMIQFSYILRKMFGEGNFTVELKIESDESYIKRSIETATKMKNVMSASSCELWRCDPKKQKEGTTYLEITKLLQGYLENEVNLNSDGTCWKKCADYYSATKSYSQKRKCHGTILKCKFVESDMTVCYGNTTRKRRYDFIEYDNGQVYGRKGFCPKGRDQVKSWQTWLFWQCSQCMCLCDEDSLDSDRHFSMKASLADIKNNMVVTGVNFIKANRVIHIRIQQGELKPNGIIDNNTIKWVPVDTFNLLDRDVLKDQTYFTLSRDNRAIDLDIHNGLDDYVLTGLRFQKIRSHLNLQIYVTKFDFKTGKLKPDMSEWLDNINTEFSPVNKRVRIDVNNRDVPTRTNKPNKIKSTNNQFLEFTHTSFENDVAQTTVPFLDSQPVTSGVTPNSGAGIYYKTSSDQSGGYIGFKLVTFNYSKYLLNKSDFD